MDVLIEIHGINCIKINIDRSPYMTIIERPLFCGLCKSIQIEGCYVIFSTDICMNRMVKRL
jgi:hypothetical protein